MPRFYCPPPIPLSGSFDLPPDAAHHASRVLRLRTGDTVEIFDGIGNACHGMIADPGPKHVTVTGIADSRNKRESPLHTLLAQALCSSEKMDWIIQKSTELGVTEIQPLTTERSVARLTVDRTARRLDHWQQVAISACEQCGRNVLPLIHQPLDIMDWLQQVKTITEAKYILLPDGTANLHDRTGPRGTAVMLVGPEGGFSQAESDTAIHCCFTPLRLGARVMRTETAAIAGLAVLQTLWGDF